MALSKFEPDYMKHEPDYDYITECVRPIKPIIRATSNASGETGCVDTVGIMHNASA